MKERNTQAEEKTGIQVGLHLVILLPSPIAFVYLFPSSSLSLQMGFGYLAKKSWPLVTLGFSAYDVGPPGKTELISSVLVPTSP